jgi:uncharacterized protein YkwD
MSEGLAPGEYGEILGSGVLASSVWKSWLASPTHRAVLLEPDWTTWGEGEAVYGRVTVYVIRFWKP